MATARSRSFDRGAAEAGAHPRHVKGALIWPMAVPRNAGGWGGGGEGVFSLPPSNRLAAGGHRRRWRWPRRGERRLERSEALVLLVERASSPTVAHFDEGGREDMALVVQKGVSTGVW